MVNYGLKDRVAIITGANNPWGIGATTALAFAREGAKVVLVYKKVHVLAKPCAEAPEPHHRKLLHLHQGDSIRTWADVCCR